MVDIVSVLFLHLGLDNFLREHDISVSVEHHQEVVCRCFLLKSESPIGCITFRIGAGLMMLQ